MPENNNTDNNISNEQQRENDESEDLEIQLAIPVVPNATYSSMPEMQRQNNNENAIPAIQYIPPTYTINGESSNVSQDMVNENMVIVYQFGKSVKCISLLDIFFGFIHLLVTPFGFFSVLFPFFGYRGASLYNKCLVDTYLGYQILYCFLNVLIFFNILFNKNFELPEEQQREQVIFLQTLTIMLNIYFIRIVGKLSYNLKKITPQQRTILLVTNFQDTTGIYL